MLVPQSLDVSINKPFKDSAAALHRVVGRGEPKPDSGRQDREADHRHALPVDSGGLEHYSMVTQLSADWRRWASWMAWTALKTMHCGPMTTKKWPATSLTELEKRQNPVFEDVYTRGEKLHNHTCWEHVWLCDTYLFMYGACVLWFPFDPRV